KCCCAGRAFRKSQWRKSNRENRRSCEIENPRIHPDGTISVGRRDRGRQTFHRQWQRNGIRTIFHAREQQRIHTESAQRRVSSEQVIGDVKTPGDGHTADGEPALAIFGNGATAQRPDGARQVVTPNHHALAQRFGLFDRFFVNSEASPDGHNWATAAFSTDYVDKGFRWQYSDRGRTYDWEGYNRLPDYEPP